MVGAPGAQMAARSRMASSLMRCVLPLAFGLAILVGSASAGGHEIEETDKILVVPPGAGSISHPGEWKLTKAHSDGFSLVEIHASEARHAWRSPRHVHGREDEAWYVIEGELTFQVGNREAVAGPGTFVYAPRNVPHRYRVTKAPARYLLIFTPSGIEPLFAEVADLRKKHEVGSPEYRAELEKLQAKYGARTVHD